MMRRYTLIFLGVLLVGVAGAKPFDPRQLSAQAKWFVHADVDQFKKTRLGKFALQQTESFSKVLKPLELMLKMEFRKDIDGLTLYGTGQGEAEAAVIVHGKFDRKHLTALAKTDEFMVLFGDIKHREHVIHRKEDKEGAHYFCLKMNHTLLMSDGLKTLRGALDVLDGKADHLKPDSIVTKATAGKHPFFLVGLVDFEALGELDADSKVFEKMKSLCFTLGEAEDNIQGRLLVQPRDRKTGEQILQIFKGMVAMVQILPEENDTELQKLKQFVEALKFELKESFVTVNWKQPVQAILDDIKLDLAGLLKNREEKD